MVMPKPLRDGLTRAEMFLALEEIAAIRREAVAWRKANPYKRDAFLPEAKYKTREYYNHIMYLAGSHYWRLP